MAVFTNVSMPQIKDPYFYYSLPRVLVSLIAEFLFLYFIYLLEVVRHAMVPVLPCRGQRTTCLVLSLHLGDLEDGAHLLLRPGASRSIGPL